MIYWVAAVEKPKKKKSETATETHDDNEKLLLEPRAIVAKSEQSAAFKVARMKELADADADRVEIIVRPF